jgi:hypothetical protein
MPLRRAPIRRYEKSVLSTSMSAIDMAKHGAPMTFRPFGTEVMIGALRDLLSVACNEFGVTTPVCGWNGVAGVAVNSTSEDEIIRITLNPCG